MSKKRRNPVLDPAAGDRRVLLYGSEQYMVHLRAGLEFSPQQHQGKSFVVVKDPVTARYFRFTESQAAILDLLRDPIVAMTDAPALAARVSEKLGASIPVATIEGFLKSLEDKWLLDTPAVREKLSNIESQKLQDRNLLYWKLALVQSRKNLRLAAAQDALGLHESLSCFRGVLDSDGLHHQLSALGRVQRRCPESV